MGQNFAYATAKLGVVDTGVVADTASFGVFCSGGTLPGCVGGARSYGAESTLRWQSFNQRKPYLVATVVSMVLVTGAVVLATDK